jgi:pimeloyl-ACP methyl ester carboxylesterase
MPEEPQTPGLERLDAALAEGDMDRVRAALAELDARELQLLEQEIGTPALTRARRAAARSRRGARLGRVIVLPGVMGSLLDSVDGKGDADRIWINPIRLISGRIGDLRLTLEGEPAVDGMHVRPQGVYKKAYLPLLVELDTRWHVRPFPFDWREDIDRSAARLDGEVKAFGAGEPVHLVAHSMGGLVSRRFIQLFRDTWKAMDDGRGAGSGGRLVMLGTPNRGSFEIPTVLTGTQDVVKKLAMADLEHNLQELLDILSTFPGLYEMLPSPLVELGDDRAKLYNRATWGGFTAHQKLLDSARAFHTQLDPVIDPQRLLYVAGYDRLTLSRIRATNGSFRYQQTRDGDGKVPHELGLLQGVQTYYVDEVHADLAKNERVLDAIHGLLQHGRTDVLPTTKPARRGSVAGGWRSAAEIAVEAVVQAEELAAIRALANKATRRGTRGAPQLTPEERIEFERLLFSDGAGAPRAVEAAPRDGEPPGRRPTVRRRLKLDVEVVWGDVTRINADLLCVGHYEGVLPQRAELALDCTVSGIDMADLYDDDQTMREEARRRLVITQQARRGQVRGSLGDVDFFPASDGKRVVAVAGMGRHGTFELNGLRRLVRGLVLAGGALPSVRTVCTVLIGSGEGTLTIDECARGLLLGIADAMAAAAVSGERIAPVTKLTVAELYRDRAHEIAATLKAEARTPTVADRFDAAGLDAAITGARRGPGGRVATEDQLTLLLEAAVRAARSPTSIEGKALAKLVEGVKASQQVRNGVRDGLKALARERGPDASSYAVHRRQARSRGGADPVRISFWRDTGQVRASAITETATVAERAVKVDPALVDELVGQMTDPELKDVPRLSDTLARLLVPHDFRTVLEQGPFVFEVDRSMAQVHWEMCAGDVGADADEEPLGVAFAVARQLRTTYSPTPGRVEAPDRALRVLVIGDPGDPEQGHDLPGARREALHVYELLTAKAGELDGRLVVEGRIGAPNVTREGRLRDVPPAERLDVLYLLMKGGYDIVHYAGHGDFDPDRPDRVGWMFAGGLLTPGELERLEEAPRLVVANACLSGRTSLVREGGKPADVSRSEAGLLPSLADEFFRLGVRNYIGSAWEVNDLGAELFAALLYESLLAGDRVGEAVRVARKALWDERGLYGALWGAYQHYGDPTSESPLAGVSGARGRP